MERIFIGFYFISFNSCFNICFLIQKSSTGNVISSSNIILNYSFDKNNVEDASVRGNDGYYGNKYNAGAGGDLRERATHQLYIYNDPLKKNNDGKYVQGQLRDAYINLQIGASGEINFDKSDNLIVQDHTWKRIWVTNLKNRPELVVPIQR